MLACRPVRRGRLSRWRAGILSRRREHDTNQGDSAEHSEPGASTSSGVPPIVQEEGASVASGGSLTEEESSALLPAVTESQSPSVQEASHEEAVGAEVGVEGSDITLTQEIEKTSEEDPLPLWLSFSPSVEHFVKGVMEATSDEQFASSLEQFEISPHKSRCLEPARSRSQGTNRVSASIGLEPGRTAQHLRSVHPVEGTCSDESFLASSESNTKHKSTISSSTKKMSAGKTHVVGLSQESLNIIKPFVEKINDNFTCKICMDRFVNVTFCPCGHYVTCRQCAQRLTECPLCRSVITHTMQVYQ